MRRGLFFGAALAAALACRSSSFFVCNDDGDCAGQAEPGVCQATGACSFPDPECPSGQRYGAVSQPSLADECVGTGAGTTGDDGPSTSNASSSTTSDPTVDPTIPVDTTGGEGPSTWWDTAWAHRQRLSLARTIDGPLTDVPLLVMIAAGRVDFERMQADGEDLRFVSASGVVAPYEIERWDPAGVSRIWINVDELGGAADHLWLYYGNPVAENAEDPAGVWPAPFVGVWHLEDDPVDSTPLDNHATAAGTTAVVPAQVGNGRNLISSARLDVEATPALADLFVGGGTVSAWIRPRGWGGSGLGRIADKESGSTGWLFYVASGGVLRFLAWLDPMANIVWETVPDSLVLHRWTHVAVTFDALGAGIPQLFVDGVETELTDPSRPSVVDMVPSDLDNPLTIGNRPTNDRRFDGILDEVRIEKTTRSPAWIGVQHDSMRDALLVYGPIESWEVVP